jgi:hypothetical protein
MVERWWFENDCAEKPRNSNDSGETRGKRSLNRKQRVGLARELVVSGERQI